MNLFKRIRKKLFKRALNKKIKQANELSKLTGYKCLVVFVNKKLKVVRKKDIKELIKLKLINSTVENLEKRALYVTT